MSHRRVVLTNQYAVKTGDLQWMRVPHSESITQLPKDLCLHLTRHKFNSKAREVYGLMETAKLLGHTNTATTERYVKVERSRLRKIQDDIDPLEAA